MSAVASLPEIRGRYLLPKTQKPRQARSRAGVVVRGHLWSPSERARYSDASAPPVRRSAGRRCQAVALSSARTSAIVLCCWNAQLSPAGTSRAAIAASTRLQAPCAGKPITASRGFAQAPQVLQVAFEYVAGQIAIRCPAGVYRGNEAVRSRHSPIVSAHSSCRLLNRCRIARRA